MCGSKNYPYLPYGRDFFLSTPPHLSENSSKKNVKHLPKFLDLYPPRNFQFLSVGVAWISSNYFQSLLLP